MALPLLAFLLGGYIFLGLMAKEYNWRVRGALFAMTLFGPAWFYFFF